MAQQVYGCGLRLMECLCLGWKDIDFTQSQIVVRSPLDSVLIENFANPNQEYTPIISLPFNWQIYILSRHQNKVNKKNCSTGRSSSSDHSMTRRGY